MRDLNYKAMKFKALLGIVLFVIGLLYWSLKEYSFVNHGSHPYETLYGITGNKESAEKLLHCLDIKSIEYTARNVQTPVNETAITKKCLEDWIDKELAHQSDQCSE